MIQNLPNFLTLSRAALGLIGGVCYVMGWKASQTGDPGTAQILFFLSLGMLIIGSLADYFDGWLARRWNTVSSLGAILDPIADKILVNAYLIAFLIRFNFDALLVVPVSLIVLRDIAVTIRRLQMPIGDQGSLSVSDTAKLKTGFQMIILLLPFLLEILDIQNWFDFWIGGVIFMALLSLYTGWIYLKPRS